MNSLKQLVRSTWAALSSPSALKESPMSGLTTLVIKYCSAPNSANYLHLNTIFKLTLGDSFQMFCGDFVASQWFQNKVLVYQK